MQHTVAVAPLFFSRRSTSSFLSTQPWRKIYARDSFGRNGHIFLVPHFSCCWSLLLDRSFSSARPENSRNRKRSQPPIVRKRWSEQLKSPPNLLTLSRIASTPLLSYFIVHEDHALAVAGCLLAGITDILDGYLARNHNMGTVLGTYLDPLADKIFINTLSVSLWWRGTLPTELVLLWVVKDIILVGATYYHVASRTRQHQMVMDPATTPLKVNPTFVSKVNTGLQFLTLTVALTHPIYSNMPDILGILCLLTGGTTVGSILSYAGKTAFVASGNEDNEGYNNRKKTRR